jgi:hypothetical protein
MNMIFRFNGGVYVNIKASPFGKLASTVFTIKSKSWAGIR